MADDKKDLKPEEQTKNGPASPEQQPPGKDAPPAKEAVGSPPAKEAPAPEKDSGPKQEKTDAAGPADKSRPGNVIDISGAMIDKIVAEKEKAAKVAEALPSERAKALKMQLEAIKHQGARETSGQIDPKEAGKRSNEIVALRNKMTVKQVQRYIKLNNLVPELSKVMDEGRIKFTPAVELAYIAPKNQQYIAVAIDAQQSAPSLSQAQRMRELDQKGVLNGDVIDGIMLEEKKEVDKVIINGAELEKYFGKEKTPQEMKEQIIKLLDDWKGKQKEHAKPEKKAEKEK